jgi:CRP/FNR family cyclic AMP-dependent transcriptional regulator
VGKSPTHRERLFVDLFDQVQAGTVRARTRCFAKGEVVFHEDDPGDSLHLIEEGLFAVEASTSVGRNVMLNILGAGSVFGEFSAFSSNGRRSSSVNAFSRGKTLAIQHDELRKALQARPGLIDDLMTAVIAKAENTQRRLVDILSIPAELRVLRALLMVDELDRRDGSIPITQTDLASLAATTRPTANRVLREEESRGSLSLSRGSIAVIDTARLARRAGVEPPFPD